VLHDVRGIAFSRFTSADVVRHPLVARIVDAYDAAGNPRPDTARATARTATNLLTKSAKPRHAKT
jgi:phosphate starvation-inducible PhoH-like protein